MTVHGWLMGEEYVVHVSDRRLTVPRSGGIPPRPVDSDAPKSLVVQGSDAIFTIGYSGLAETIDGLPVDVLIAEAISGVELQHGWTGTTFPVPNKRYMNHWDVAERVVARLQKEFARCRVPGWEVVLGLGGYHYRRSLPVLFFRSYEIREAGVFRWSPTTNKNIERRGRSDVAATGSGAQLLLKGINSVLNVDQSQRGTTHEHFLLELAKVGRGVSSVEPTVGPDFMFTTLTSGPPAALRVQYVPATQGIGIQMMGSLIDEMFTPWVITPGAVHFPSIMVGHVHSMSGINVEVVPPPGATGPQGEYDVVFGLYPHARPRWRRQTPPKGHRDAPSTSPGGTP